MLYRTDLALEACEDIKTDEGLEISEKTSGNVTVTRIRVRDARGERAGREKRRMLRGSFPASAV